MMDLQKPCSKGCKMNETGDPQNDCGNCYMNDGAESAKVGTFQEPTHKESLTAAADAPGKPVTVATPEFRALILKLWNASGGIPLHDAKVALIAHIDAHTAQAVAAMDDELAWYKESLSRHASKMKALGDELEALRSAAPQQHAQAALSKAQIDAIVYQCRQSGNDTTYDIVAACISAANVKPAQADLSEAIEAMGRAKKLTIWDNDVPHALHVELDIIFKALAASQQPAAAPGAPAGREQAQESDVSAVGKGDSAGREADAPATNPQEARQDDHDNAVRLLGLVFDAWENGDSCYEDPENSAGYLGMAFRLDDAVFDECCELLNRRNPPRNAAPAAQVAAVPEDVMLAAQALLHEHEEACATDPMFALLEMAEGDEEANVSARLLLDLFKAVRAAPSPAQPAEGKS